MFEFAWLWCFLLLPLPWIYRRWLPPAKSRSAALQVSFMARLSALQPLSPAVQPPGRKWPYLIVWVLLVSAAARPQWLGDQLPTATTGRDMMLAVDLSGSMEFRDMRLDGEPVDRLTLVKHLLGEFIESRRGDRLGLILFGSQAFVQAPLTHDRHAIRVWLEESFIGLPGRQTAIGDAIGLAVKRLIEEPESSRVLVLLTDGANTAGNVSPLRAARLAAEHQIRIFTIGVGADPQSDEDSITDAWGLQYEPSIELDEGTLRQIAWLTGGEYFRTRTGTDLQAIYAQLDKLEPSLRAGIPDRSVTPLYPWPLALAWLLSLIFSVRVITRKSIHA